jgi:hypothetical protein
VWYRLFVIVNCLQRNGGIAVVVTGIDAALWGPEPPIQLGDELVSVDGVLLSQLTFVEVSYGLCFRPRCHLARVCGLGSGCECTYQADLLIRSPSGKLFQFLCVLPSA